VDLESAQLGTPAKVHVGSGTTVGSNVKLIGPVIVGENCTLENCTVGPHVTLGTGTTIRGTVITNSIVFSRTVIDGVSAMADSLVGDRVRITQKVPGETARVIVGDDTVMEI